MHSIICAYFWVYKRNNIAMANFTMAFTSESLMGLVYKAQSTKWPAGKASVVVKALLAKYMPKDRISRVELRQMLASVSMKDNEDPATLFEQISAIENKYNTVTACTRLKLGFNESFVFCKV